MAKVTLDRDTFKALASETRLALLHGLDSRRKTGSELARELELNKATVHEHLQLLATVGLVKKIDEGRKWIYYELSWQGRKLLHPEQGASFAVMLGLSVLSAGGAFAMLARALEWWRASDPSSDGVEELSAADESDDADGTSEAPPESESMLFDRGAAESSQDMSDPGFFDQGGWWVVAFALFSALCVTLAALLRFRAPRKS